MFAAPSPSKKSPDPATRLWRRGPRICAQPHPVRGRAYRITPRKSGRFEQVCHNGPVIDTDEIRSALEVVIDPELHRSIVELDMVRSIDVSANGVVDVTVSLTTPGCPIKGHFQTAVAGAVSALEGVSNVNVYFELLADSQKDALPQVANVLCIGSGKGGVGKSTLTANLAASLVGEGKRVGVLDADVWGYSIPRMYGLGSTRPPGSPEGDSIRRGSEGG